MSSLVCTVHNWCLTNWCLTNVKRCLTNVKREAKDTLARPFVPSHAMGSAAFGYFLISCNVPTDFEVQRLKGTLLLKLGEMPPISANWR